MESSTTPELSARPENPVPEATYSDCDPGSVDDKPKVVTTSCDYLHYLFSNIPDNTGRLEHHVKWLYKGEGRHCRAAFHIYDLMCAGKLKDVRTFCEFFSAEDQKIILNTTHEFMYDGTVLHALLYHNIGEEAIELYKYLRSLGAQIVPDYYGYLPWNNKGNIFTCLPTEGCTYRRVNSEFVETNSAVREWEIIHRLVK